MIAEPDRKDVFQYSKCVRKDVFHGKSFRC